MIYIIQCPCNKIHVGETSHSLKERITGHRSAIHRKDLKSPVARQVCKCNHKMSSFFLLGIEKIKQNSRGGNIGSIRKKREAFWIFYLKSLFPKGMNNDFSLKNSLMVYDGFKYVFVMYVF